jgi:endonuclease III
VPRQGEKAGASFRSRIAELRRLYGKPKAPAVTDPFEQVLWENVAYLADDARRSEAFAMLREKVGVSPQEILAAPREALHEIGRRGILPAGSAEKLREIARIALADLSGDLRSIRKLSLKDAKKALRKFPSIGEPAAEKILLFAGSHAVFSMDSNALRVLLRLGYGKEQKSYAASYRSVQDALAAELPRDRGRLVEAYQLLRRHGQELCKRSQPRCEACPLRAGCAYGRSARNSS